MRGACRFLFRDAPGSAALCRRERLCRKAALINRRVGFLTSPDAENRVTAQHICKFGMEEVAKAGFFLSKLIKLPP